MDVPYHGPQLARSFAISFWFEAAVYGINCCLFSGATFLLFRRPDVNKFLVGSSVVLFLFATAHAGITMRQLLEAFTDPEIVATPRGADLYFAQQSRPLAVAQYATYVFNLTAQDTLLIWRLWIMWSKDWRVIVLPIIIQLVHVASSLTTVVTLARQPNYSLGHEARATMITCRALNLVLYCGLTTAIVYRLWWAHRKLGRPFLDGGRYKGALLTVAESGAVFAAASIVVFSLSIMDTPALAAAVSPTTQLATAVPLLVVVRAGFEAKLRESQWSMPRSSLNSGPPSMPPTPRSPGMNKTEIRISRFEESEVDYSMSPLKGYTKDHRSLTSAGDV